MNDYCIAGLPVRMQCHYPRTQTQSEAYRAPFCSGTPIIIDISLETLINYSQNHPSLSPEGWEYMMTGKIFYHHLTEHQGLMLHASAVVVDGWAYLFSADSGTGKSTHTSQWLDYFGDRAFILNDDKPAIRRINGSYQVFGTPWSGKTGQNVNTAAPLAGIAFLERSQNNWITPMTPGEAFPLLMRQTMRRLSTRRMECLLNTVEDLLIHTSLYHMGCTISQEAAVTAYMAMKPNDMERKEYT